MRHLLFCTLAALPLASFAAEAPGFSFSDSQQLLDKYCASCHSAKSHVAGFSISRLNDPKTLAQDPQLWTHVLARVRNGEMPPKSLPAPAADIREQFVTWLDSTLRTAVCAG